MILALLSAVGNAEAISPPLVAAHGPSRVTGQPRIRSSASVVAAAVAQPLVRATVSAAEAALTLLLAMFPVFLVLSR